MKCRNQILSLGLFTKSPISSQTKAIVPKAVILVFSMIWICKPVWIENQNKADIYPKRKNACWWQKRMTTRISERSAETWHWEGFMLPTIIPFLSKRFGAFFYQFSLPYFKITLWVRILLKNFQELWKMSNVLMREEGIKVHHFLYVTPKEVKGLCHFTLPLILGLNGRGMTLHSLLMNLSHNYEWQRTQPGPHLRLHVGFPGQKWL